MTVALVEGDAVAIGHVGDSRAYLVRDGQIEQLTEDHSLVAELVRAGKLTAEEARDPPAALGDHARARHRARRRDRHVRGRGAGRRHLPALLRRAHDDGRRRRRSSSWSRQAAAISTRRRETLVGAANRGGGEDNITVVCFGSPRSRTADEDAAEPRRARAPAPSEDTLDRAHRRRPSSRRRAAPRARLACAPRSARWRCSSSWSSPRCSLVWGLVR